MGCVWLAGQLWGELQLDWFLDRPPAAEPQGYAVDQVLQVLVSYGLIAPGSKPKLHRDWFGRSAVADLLRSDFSPGESRTNSTPVTDFLLKHKADFFTHLVSRWRDLFNADFNGCWLYVFDEHLFRDQCRGRARGRHAPPRLQPLQPKSGSWTNTWPVRCGA